jgi:hypothetical protein
MNLRDWCAWQLGMAYPPVLLVGYLMGFPEGWTICAPSETPSSLKSRNSSVKP